MEEFKLTDEELKKVSGGFSTQDFECLTEEEKRRWEEMSTRTYELHQGLPETRQEYDIAFKELLAYHLELMEKVHLRQTNPNQ